MENNKYKIVISFALLLLAIGITAVILLYPGVSDRTGQPPTATVGRVVVPLAPEAWSAEQATVMARATQTGAAPTPVAGLQTGREAQRDISPPLRDIPPIQPATPPEVTARGKPQKKILAVREPREQVVDAVRQLSFNPNLPSLLAPTPSVNFEGVGNLDGVYPPDTEGDVGLNHYVQWVNLHFQIWDKQGNSLYGPARGSTLWAGFGGPCEFSDDGDPVVLYDQLADRWLMSQFISTSPYGECVAISTTGDPTGSYYRYFFQFSDTQFYDYPKLAVWPDGYYFTANRFTYMYLGASAIVLERARMLIGQSATYQEFQVSGAYGPLLPADLDGATEPPAGSPGYFAEIGIDAIHLWRLAVNWANPANTSFTGPASIPVAAYNELCPYTRACIPQPGTSTKVDGIGDRLMFRMAYRNFGDHETLVMNHSVNAASLGIQAGVRWYEVRDPGGAPFLYQQGTYAPDNHHRWMGSLAMDRDGNLALGYNISSDTVYPGIRYTGRLASDPLGVLPQGETSLIEGGGSQLGTAWRWGDYSFMAVDPVDDCTFWYTNQYISFTGTAPWKTRIGAFRFPSCTGPVLPTPTPTPTATATLTPTPRVVGPNEMFMPVVNK